MKTKQAMNLGWSLNEAQSTLTLTGVLTRNTVPKIHAALPQLKSAITSVDIDELERLDSAGLAFLLNWFQTSKAELKGANEQAKTLASIMGVASLIPFA